MNYMLQPKFIYWLNGYKNKTYTYAIYKRPTPDLRKHTDWKWGDKKIFLESGNQKKVGVAILIPHKINFKIKTVPKGKEYLIKE